MISRKKSEHEIIFCIFELAPPATDMRQFPERNWNVSVNPHAENSTDFFEKPRNRGASPPPPFFLSFLLSNEFSHDTEGSKSEEEEEEEEEGKRPTPNREIATGVNLEPSRLVALLLHSPKNTYITNLYNCFAKT